MNNRQLRKLCQRAAAILDGSSIEDAQPLVDELKAAVEDGREKWWVVVLKVLLYAIGLILAGYGTPAAAATLGIL